MSFPLQNLYSDLRLALRQLRRSPGFALTVIATLGIGIGLNVAIFTVVDCVILRPLGYHDADRIVALQTHLLDESRSIPRLGGDDYTDLSHQVSGLEATAFYQSGSDGVECNGASLYLPAAAVSPRFGEVMGVEPSAGRLFRPGDADNGDALVSASFARTHFGSAQAALGQVLRSEGTLHPVIGVLPEGFSFPGKTAIWFNIGAKPQSSSRTSYNQQAVGKRRAGVSTAQLAAQLAAFSSHLQTAFPDDRHKAIEAVPLQEQLVGKIRPTLHLLMGSVAVILLIVLANVTHLQLVRATRELRSVTIRAALGASRTALASRALLEAALLAAAGCGAALLLAIPALQLLLRIAPPDVPRLNDVHLNFDVLLFSFLASLLLMCLTAVLPVWRSWHVDPALALRQDASRGTESRGSLRLRNGLLVAEIALTLSLSVSAILLARQLMQQSRQDLGFSAENLITLDSHFIESTAAPRLGTATTPPAKAAAVGGIDAFNQNRLASLDSTLATVAGVPGVESVAAIEGAPMGFDRPDVGYAVRGRQVFAPGVEHLPNADISAVTPGLFNTMRIPLLRGRALTSGDRSGTPPVLLISQGLARAVFPNQDPVGQQIMCGLDETSTWWTIVGVVGDIRANSPGSAPYPAMYVPIAQHPDRAADMQLMVRTRTDPSAMLETLRNKLKQTHPDIAIKGTTMRANIAGTERTDRFRTTLFASFAAVSILLAGVGLYGVTAYTVAQRRFEFGLRIALGANREQILALVLRGTAKVAVRGIAIGTALSPAVSHILGSVVGQLPAFDALAYVLAALTVLLLSVAATLLPARTAATSDPMQALRSE